MSDGLLFLSCGGTPWWQGLITGIGAPLAAALLAAWVGITQSRISREKLRWDLYQRRFQVYDAAVCYVQVLYRDRELVSPEAKEVADRFARAKLESSFLFSDESEVRDIMEGMHNAGTAIKGLNSMLRDQTNNLPPEVVADHSDTIVDHYSSLDPKLHELRAAMGPYLNFKSLNQRWGGKAASLGNRT